MTPAENTAVGCCIVATVLAGLAVGIGAGWEAGVATVCGIAAFWMFLCAAAALAKDKPKT